MSARNKGEGRCAASGTFASIQRQAGYICTAAKCVGRQEGGQCAWSNVYVREMQSSWAVAAQIRDKRQGGRRKRAIARGRRACLTLQQDGPTERLVQMVASRS